jgi:hypothetical protein
MKLLLVLGATAGFVAGVVICAEVARIGRETHGLRLIINYSFAAVAAAALLFGLSFTGSMGGVERYVALAVSAILLVVATWHNAKRSEPGFGMLLTLVQLIALPTYFPLKLLQPVFMGLSQDDPHHYWSGF